MSIKGENIYKRKDHRWEGRYIRARNQDGTIRYGYCYAKTYREVKQKLLACRKNVNVHTTDSETRKIRTLSDYCDEWLKLRRLCVKESTLVKYNGFLVRYIKPCLGNVAIPKLSNVMVEEFTHKLLYEYGLSAKTARDITTVLHGVLKYAAQQHTEMPVTPQLPYPQTPRKEMRVLSREEQKTIMDHLLCNDNLYSFGILLCLMTGMRIGELCALKWKDISLENRCIRIGSTMQRIADLDPAAPMKTKIIITAPKSDSGFRVVPMTDQAYALCEKYWCTNPEAFVLTGMHNSFVEPRTMQNRFRKIVTNCGLEGVHFHTLRHTFATRCVEADFEIKTLSEIMGHASPKITLERYVHASLQLKRENMDKLAVFGL